MTDIEFVDGPSDDADARSPEDIGERAPATSGGVRARAQRLSGRPPLDALTAGLCLGAAALAVVAALTRVYEIGYGPHASVFRYSVDALGNYHGAGELTREHQHAARNGIILIACAVVLLAVAAHPVLPLARFPRAWRLADVAPYLSVAATGVLGGVVLATYLDADAVMSSLRAQTQIDVAAGDPVRGDLVTLYGPSLWFGLGAVACAAVASATVTARARRGPR